MPKKSILGKIYSEYKKDQRQRERLQVQLRRDHERARLQAEKAAQQAELRDQRARDREIAAARKRAEAAERDARRAAAGEATVTKQTSRQAREQHVEGEQLLAAAQTEAIAREIAAFASVIRTRDRSIEGRQSMLAQAHASWGTSALERSLLEALNGTRSGRPSIGTIEALTFRAEAGQLFMDYELPPRSVVPDLIGYKYVKTRDAIEPVARAASEVRATYADLIARVAIRALRESFDATPGDLVNEVVFNGHVRAIDGATGRDIRPCVLSVGATRSAMDDLRIDVSEFKPVDCLKGPLGAIVSPHPFDLEPVKPVVQFDLSRYKIVPGVDAIADLDSRLDVLSLTPTEFEHLVRQLVEAMGLKAWATQASNDDGVDAVAVNEAPLIGGLCIIQAKRYKGIVSHESIQALAGVMDDKRASRGILITTSWVGQKSRDFAARHGRMEIYEGRELKSLLTEHLGVDPLIKLPVAPRGWTERDIA